MPRPRRPTPSPSCSPQTTGRGTAAVALGRRVWAAAPSVRSADALGWALTRAGRPAAGYRWALRAPALGSRDATFRLHAGIAARRAGLAAAAARHLAIAAAARPALTPGRAGAAPGGRAMRALLLGLAAALAVALAVAPRADAHPLGNFSVNHLSVVSVSDDRVDVRYVLDQAEIPTVQEDRLSRAEVLARKRAEVERRLVLTVDGRRVALVPAGPPRAAASPPARAGCGRRGSSCPCARVWMTRAASSCTTEPSPAGSGGRPSSHGPATAPRCARARRAATPPTACAATPRTCCRARSTSARRLPGRAGRRHAGRSRRRARRGGRDARHLGRLRRPVRGRRFGPGRAARAAGGRLRLGRPARPLAGPRQGDGRGLPGRHARHGRGTRSRSARRSRSRTRSACSRSAS